MHLWSQHTYGKMGPREMRIRQKLKGQLVWSVLHSGRRKRLCHKTVEDRESAHTQASTQIQTHVVGEVRRAGTDHLENKEGVRH